MAELTLQQDGARVYVLGQTYALRDALRAAGGHWDSARRAWWVGRAKRAEIEAVIAREATAATETERAPAADDRKPREDARVLARAAYKGKDYYVIAETRDGARRLLAARDGAFQFWAAADLAPITKHYGREDYRSGRTEYPTLSGMISRAREWRSMSREERTEATEDAEARRSGDACPCSGGACRCGSDSPCCMCW